MSGTVAIVPFG